MEEFTIEIAGIPCRIRCRFDVNRAFLRDYLSGKEPLFTVEPGDAELQSMQADFERMDEKEGKAAICRSDAFLENNAIHAMLAKELVSFNVLLMHGSALCMDGEAYIFTAPSGTGKSTHARLWREVFGDRVRMINDDKPMLKITENGAAVWGTPWNGKHHLSMNGSAPLKAIVSLSRDDSNHIRKMTSAEAFPLLMKQAYGSEDPVTMMRIMELEKQLLNTVDFYAMGCNMSPDAAREAWNGMNNG